MIQITYLYNDINRMIGRNKYRWLYVWISRSFIGIFSYRLERSFYLITGENYKYLRILILPILTLFQVYSNMDINYKADIKGGFLILHPALGCVISGYSIIGEHLTLTGGNVIGLKKAIKHGEFIIGNGCTLGANAVILGPMTLGDNIQIGASACVTQSFVGHDVTLVGVPAKLLRQP
jgi:serine acetyltransferase